MPQSAFRGEPHRLSPQDRERETIRTLYPPLRRYAKLVGPPETDPEDLVQEALARTIRLSPISELPNPAAYLRRVICNIASNERRRLARRRRALARLLGELTITDSYESDLCELMALDPTARTAVYLSMIEGYGYKQIGELIGCTEAAARQMAWRGRRLLRSKSSDATGGRFPARGRRP